MPTQSPPPASVWCEHVGHRFKAVNQLHRVVGADLPAEPEKKWVEIEIGAGHVEVELAHVTVRGGVEPDRGAIHQTRYDREQALVSLVFPPRDPRLGDADDAHTCGRRAVGKIETCIPDQLRRMGRTGAEGEGRVRPVSINAPDRGEATQIPHPDKDRVRFAQPGRERCSLSVDRVHDAGNDDDVGRLPEVGHRRFSYAVIAGHRPDEEVREQLVLAGTPTGRSLIDPGEDVPERVLLVSLIGQVVERL